MESEYDQLGPIPPEDEWKLEKYFDRRQYHMELYTPEKIKENPPFNVRGAVNRYFDMVLERGYIELVREYPADMFIPNENRQQPVRKYRLTKKGQDYMLLQSL